MDTPKPSKNYFKPEGEFSHPQAFFQRLDFLIRSFHNNMLSNAGIRTPVMLLYAELKPFLSEIQIKNYKAMFYKEDDDEKKNVDGSYSAFIYLLRCCHDLGFTIPDKKGEYDD